MRVDIVVSAGPATGRRILLRAGQAALFGRSEWADFAFSVDPSMAELHFEIRCSDKGCDLNAVANDVPTLVNGQEVKNVRLKSGDKVLAGSTQLTLQIVGAADDTGVSPSTSPEAAQLPPDETLQLSKYFELSEPAQKRAEAVTDPDKFETELITAELLLDAVRWRAHYWPKPKVVRWALDCLASEPALAHSPTAQPGLKLAEAWCAEPNEANRQAAAQELELSGAGGLSGMLTAAVAWSGGSLAPEGQEPVPPDERLTGQCINTVITMVTHLSRTPESIMAKLTRYLNT